MTKSEFIAGRLQEVLLDGHWIANTNFKEKIESITWIQATQKVGDLNTIAALTFHINYYLAGILQVFKGGRLEISDKYSFDLAPVKSISDWQHLINTFLFNAGDFVNHVKSMPEEKLNEIFVHEKYGTYLRNIEGVIEHSYYHLGQITLIKKMLENIQ